MIPRTIGILGGMGPQATILLQERLLKAVKATDDSDHIPLMVDMNPQVPSRIQWLLEKRGTDPGATLASMSKRLQRAGAQALAMPCNTAHAFAKEIVSSTTVPFFNMPELAAAHLAQHHAKGATIGILASPATQATGLFAAAFEPYGLEALYPAAQHPILQTIKDIKATGPNAAARATLNTAAMDIVANGAQAILVGCSEFSLLSHQITTPVPVVDTLDILSQRLVEFSLQNEDKPPP